MKKYLNDTGLSHLIQKIRAELLNLRAQIESGGGSTVMPQTWEEVQSIVREGRAPATFSIGDQLVCNHDTLGEIVWDIVGFNADEDASGAAHTMTLQTHDLITSETFDFDEAIYVAAQDIPPNTTCVFTLPEEYRQWEGGGETLSFTTDRELFRNTLFVFHWPAEQYCDEGTIQVYEDKDVPGHSSEYPVSLGGTGMELTPLNHPAFGNGNNLWSQSFLRKYLNDDAWQSSTAYDITAKEQFEGFQSGLDEDFLSVLGTLRITEQDALQKTAYQCTDKFSLPSFGSVNGGSGPCASDTKAYPYYGEEEPGMGAQAKRIKTQKGRPAPYFLRSPDPNDCGMVFFVAADGSISTKNANESLGIAPICCIS